MAKTILHLGSNLGDRQANLLQAIAHLNDLTGSIIQQSSFFETAAWGVEDQPSFFNIALICQTNLSPDQLLKSVLEIERLMGRERKKRWGVRLIDIDILFYNDWRITYPDLIIPHPSIQDRNFVLQPLLEIAPNLLHPVLKKTIKELAAQCEDSLLVKLIPKSSVIPY